MEGKGSPAVVLNHVGDRLVFGPVEAIEVDLDVGDQVAEVGGGGWIVRVREEVGGGG